MFLRPSFVSGVRRPHLDRFYVERIQKARLYTDWTFHSLVSLQRLATWGLGPIPSAEALHTGSLLVDVSYFYLLLLSFFYFIIIYIFIFKTDVFPFRNGDNEGE